MFIQSDKQQLYSVLPGLFEQLMCLYDQFIKITSTFVTHCINWTVCISSGVGGGPDSMCIHQIPHPKIDLLIQMHSGLKMCTD